MNKRKMTTGDLFGGLLRGGVRRLRVDESSPAEVKDLLDSIQGALEEKESAKGDDFEGETIQTEGEEL